MHYKMSVEPACAFFRSSTMCFFLLGLVPVSLRPYFVNELKLLIYFHFTGCTICSFGAQFRGRIVPYRNNIRLQWFYDDHLGKSLKYNYTKFFGITSWCGRGSWENENRVFFYPLIYIIHIIPICRWCMIGIYISIQ